MSITFHTVLGDLKFELFCEITPKACKNFLGLAASGYYESTVFHRSIRGFMVQGGAPRGSLKGKGGESIYGAPFEDEINPNLTFDKRGLLAMANKGPNTNTSQFFISFKEAPHLNSTATIFGKLIHGWETLDEMENVEVDAKNRPINAIYIQKITIHANPIAMDEI